MTPKNVWLAFKIAAVSTIVTLIFSFVLVNAKSYEFANVLLVLFGLSIIATLVVSIIGIVKLSALKRVAAIVVAIAIVILGIGYLLSVGNDTPVQTAQHSVNMMYV